MARALGLCAVVLLACTGGSSATPSPAAATATKEAKPEQQRPPEPEPEPTAEPDAPRAAGPTAVDWASLQPIHHVSTTRDGALRVHAPELDASVAKKYAKAYMDVVEFAADDRRLPPRVRAMADLVVLLPAGLQELGSPTRAHFGSSPFGDDWALEFAFRGPETHGLALASKPHPGATLTKPGEEFAATGALRRALTDAAPAKFRPRSGTDVMASSAPVRLPAGAVKVVSGWWPEGEGSRSYAVVVSVDDTDAVVHTVSIHRDYLGWASITWVADLDGDGIDEVGWGFGGSEDEAYFLTHFDGGTQTRLDLYASGH